MEELRLYSWVNFYLSSIQQGIQTGHMSDEMTCRYCLIDQYKDPAAKLWINWISTHKTYIILNGGDSQSIYDLYSNIAGICSRLNLPYSKFNEPGCNNMMTCVGAVIPARYFAAEYDTTNRDVYLSIIGSLYNVYGVDSDEYDLIKLIKSCQLAK
jgi:hypothetical protein